MLSTHNQESNNIYNQSNASNTNTPSEPQLDPMKIDKDFLYLCLRQTELELKAYTTLEEDLELELLRDPKTCYYARRIVELEFKEDKNYLEKKELTLLKDPSTRAYAKRIIELDRIPNKNYLEDIEADVLANPQFRPNYQEFLNLAAKLMNQTFTSDQERRACFLILNRYTVPRTHEILELENKSELTSEEIKQLSKDYLIRICQIPENLVKELDQYDNTTSIFTKSCLSINKKIPMHSKAIDRYISVKDEINFEAKNLAEQACKQAVASQIRNSFFNTKNNNFNHVNINHLNLDNIMSSPSMQSFIQKKQEMIALILKKIFFDFDCGFDQQRLNILTGHLSKQVSTKKVDFSTSDFKELFTKIQKSLNEIEIDEPAVGARVNKRW